MRFLGIKLWPLIIPILIAVLFVALGIWPGEAIRTYTLKREEAKPILLASLDEEVRSWTEKGTGYGSKNAPPVKHGEWVEVSEGRGGRPRLRCAGEYKRGKRTGRWTIRRNGKLVRESFFKDGRLVRVIEWINGEKVEITGRNSK